MPCLVLILICCATLCDDDRPQAADTMQRARGLAQQLRSNRLADSERAALEQQLLALGDAGAATLRDVLIERISDLEGDVERARRTYLDHYRKVAKRQIGLRAKRARREVDELRATIEQLRRGPLTKQQIIEVGDPALQRLSDILSIDNADILTDQESLLDERDALLDLTFRLQDVKRRALECAASLPLDRDHHEPDDAEADGDEPDPVTALNEDEAALAMLALPMSGRDRDVLLANRDLTDQVDVEELRGVEALNLLRIRLGLAALAIDLRLTEACRDHSQDMATLGFFDHTSPVPGKTTFGQRAARFKTSARSENIAAGMERGEDAIRGWWHSPGHHKNMLGSHQRIGLGRYDRTWTQLFG